MAVRVAGYVNRAWIARRYAAFGVLGEGGWRRRRRKKQRDMGVSDGQPKGAACCEGVAWWGKGDSDADRERRYKQQISSVRCCGTSVAQRGVVHRERVVASNRRLLVVAAGRPAPAARGGGAPPEPRSTRTRQAHDAQDAQDYRSTSSAPLQAAPCPIGRWLQAAGGGGAGEGGAWGGSRSGCRRLLSGIGEDGLLARRRCAAGRHRLRRPARGCFRLRRRPRKAMLPLGPCPSRPFSATHMHLHLPAPWPDKPGPVATDAATAAEREALKSRHRACCSRSPRLPGAAGLAVCRATKERPPALLQAESRRRRPQTELAR